MAGLAAYWWLRACYYCFFSSQKKLSLFYPWGRKRKSCERCWLEICFYLRAARPFSCRNGRIQKERASIATCRSRSRSRSRTGSGWIDLALRNIFIYQPRDRARFCRIAERTDERTSPLSRESRPKDTTINPKKEEKNLGTLAKLEKS